MHETELARRRAKAEAIVDHIAHDYAHSHYTRIDWAGARVDFTAGAKWALAYLLQDAPEAPVAEDAA